MQSLSSFLESTSTWVEKQLQVSAPPPQYYELGRTIDDALHHPLNFRPPYYESQSLFTTVAAEVLPATRLSAHPPFATSASLESACTHPFADVSNLDLENNHTTRHTIDPQYSSIGTRLTSTFTVASPLAPLCVAQRTPSTVPSAQATWGTRLGALLTDVANLAPVYSATPTIARVGVNSTLVEGSTFDFDLVSQGAYLLHLAAAPQAPTPHFNVAATVVPQKNVAILARASQCNATGPRQAVFGANVVANDTSVSGSVQLRPSTLLSYIPPPSSSTSSSLTTRGRTSLDHLPPHAFAAPGGVGVLSLCSEDVESNGAPQSLAPLSTDRGIRALTSAERAAWDAPVYRVSAVKTVAPSSEAARMVLGEGPVHVGLQYVASAQTQHRSMSPAAKNLSSSVSVAAMKPFHRGSWLVEVSDWGKHLRVAGVKTFVSQNPGINLKTVSPSADSTSPSSTASPTDAAASSLLALMKFGASASSSIRESTSTSSSSSSGSFSPSSMSHHNQFPSVTFAGSLITSIANLTQQHAFEFRRALKQSERIAQEQRRRSAMEFNAAAAGAGANAGASGSASHEARGDGPGSLGSAAPESSVATPSAGSGNWSDAAVGSTSSSSSSSWSQMGSVDDAAGPQPPSWRNVYGLFQTRVFKKEFYTSMPRAVVTDLHNTFFGQGTVIVAMAPQLTLTGHLDTHGNLVGNLRLRTSSKDTPYTNNSFNNRIAHGVMQRGPDEGVSPMQATLRAQTNIHETMLDRLTLTLEIAAGDV